MFKDDIFEEWLDSESQKVLKKFQSNDNLSIEDKMILTLKAQTNHFYHLDKDIRKDIADLNNKTMTAIADLDNKTMTAIADLKKDSNEKFEKMDTKFEQMDTKFEQMDTKFEKMDTKFEQLSQEIKNIYKAINSQTWKMLGSIGLIVILSKLAESLPYIKF